MSMGYDNFLSEDHYKVPLIAKLLHTLPHYNITFHRTNNTFKPTDEIYLEVKKLAAQIIFFCRNILLLLIIKPVSFVWKIVCNFFSFDIFATEFGYIGKCSCCSFNHITVRFTVVFNDTML